MPPHGDVDADADSDAHLFAGVRFALFGFDPLSESQYRLEIERCGGVDAGPWDGDCSHVIVSNDILYDDPVCVATRNDGKKVVTAQWVEDSFELGALADADRVLYAPVRDPRGIPGSDKLNISLTGYQKNWREDIMRMVSMMGANFSKSLAANISTHLICYKFEGEKYELAKRVKIKLVNHRWLEECLRAWEILPVDDYTKSGWEVEIMEAQAKDSEDETEDAGRDSSSSRRIGRITPSTEIRMKSHVDSAVEVPNRGSTISTSNVEGATGRQLATPEQIMKSDDTGMNSFDIRDDSGSAPDTKCAAISVDRDFHKSAHCHIYRSENDEAPADQVSRDEAKDDHEGLNTRASTICTPSIHKSIAPTIPADNREDISGNCLHSSNQINANNDLWPDSSEENRSKKISHSTDFSRKVDQKDDGHKPEPKTAISQSSVEEKLNMHSNPESRNKQISSYSRRRSLKSVSPEANLRPVHQAISPQCSEGNTSRIELNTTPRKNDQEFNEHADTQIQQENKVKRRKNILSSGRSKVLNEAADSGTGISSSPFSSKESASEAAASNVGRSPAESTKADGVSNNGPIVHLTGKKVHGPSKSNLRRTSLKLVNSDQVETLPENSDADKNVGMPGEVKAPALHEATTKNLSSTFPSVNSDVRKESSPGSFGDEDTELTDALQENNIEAAAPCSESERVVSDQNLVKDPKETPVDKWTDERGTFTPKMSTSRVRSAGAKRSQNAGSKAAPKLISSIVEVASSKDKIASHENIETQQGHECCGPNADKSTPSPAEVLNNKSRKEALNNSLGSDRKMNESLAASKAESAKPNITTQRNKKGDRRKLSITTSADANQSSSQMLPNSESSNSVAKGSRTADASMSDSPTFDETETVPPKSGFNEAVPPENGVENHKCFSVSLSTDGPETCAENKVPNNRVRKVVAKRKLSAVQKQQSGSEPCKSASVLVSKDKAVSTSRAVHSSRNANKVAVDQDLQNSNNGRMDDTVVPSRKDALKERSKEMQSSKSGSGKRQKTADLVHGLTDHDKENIPVNSNIISNTKCGNNSMTSKPITKALRSSKSAHDKNSMIKRNDYGALNVSEPTWFILSGHRLLRKEFKAILRRLKGRVCRDSHNWSFQATHLVTTELRRTEKFFAAAAAGRWILRPEYLTACNEAGKFLGEEPFEWHGHGLNSGDTISLDAPRKWRQLKQRTGHGAFYGMQVVIYGECIAPTLDTLKRTIRSGDGTILATSPPYTRSLKSNVDFAVVSAGMPSVDAWVQEFMRHNIPCISADYLVEYVCKPGHPLSKHVLFNMHDLAERSLQKLLKSQEDAGAQGVEAEAESESCSACGSNNRQGLMLVCGSSDGNQAGCGVRVHAECCDPPVVSAPEAEWLCNKCDHQQKPAKKAKKAAAKSRVLRCR